MLGINNKAKSVSAESYKTLRTNIQYSSVDKKIKCILITSAEPAEGKSTTASNLAISFAEEDKKVIIIDCDLRKPSLHKKFRVSNVIGLSDILVGKSTIDESITKFSENLSILTSGKTPPNPSEMLGSKNMTKLLEQIKST